MYKAWADTDSRVFEMLHIGSTVRLAALGAQVTSEVLSQVHFAVGPLGP